MTLPHTLAQLYADAPRLFRWISRPYAWALEFLWRLAWSPHGRIFLAAAFFTGLAALVVLAQLQALLAAMHLPGETAFDLGGLARRPDAAIETWREHADRANKTFADPKLIVALFAAIDTFLLVPAYSIVLGTAAVAAWAALRSATNGDPLLPAYRAITAVAFLVVPLLVIVDVLENADTLAIVLWDGKAPAFFEAGLEVLWLAKYAIAAVVFVPIAIAGVALARRSGADGFGFLRTIVVLRVHIALVLLFAVFLFAPIFGEQIDDVMRRWISSDWLELVAAAVLTALFSALLLATAWRLLIDQQDLAAERTDPRVLLAAGAALVVAWPVLELLDLGGRGFFALGLVLLVVGALSYPLREIVAAARPAAVTGSVTLPAILAALPLVLLGLAAVRASIFELVYAGRGWYALLLLAGLGLQALGWATYILARRAAAESIGDPVLASSRWVVPAGAVLAAAAAVAVWLDPWAVGDALGTVGVFAAGVIALALLGYLALRFEHDRLSPPAFLVLGLRRFPVLIVVALWALVAAKLDPGGFHDVRTIARSEGAAPVQLQDVWERWLARQPTDRAAVPLVLVAAEGGGIRAAYWTARALDCAVDADYPSCGFVPNGEAGDPRALFAASGISGGSLGLAAYVAALREDERGDWVDERLGDDFLAATSAWTLFVDLPNGLLKLDLESDRAGVLEEAWQRSWGDPSPLAAGHLSSWAKDERVPLLLLSGTSVQDGCRVNTSALDADVEEPETKATSRARDCLSMEAFAAGSAAKPAAATLAATHDVYDLLCESKDVRLSTAALLSARFPWVSPAGRVERCNTDFATFVVDGGYFDTSASSPIQELWSRLEPLVEAHNAGDDARCVVPFLLQLDNHYKEPRNPGASGRPWEAVVPLAAVRAARDARENGARQAAALSFSADRVGGVQASDGEVIPRYAQLFPRSHPGTSAPLGWALSQASMDDLTVQLGGPDNADELGTIRRWFSPQLSCVGR